MRIGILTGGGDVPGLNPCIKSVVYLAADAGAEVVGFRRGWAGLLNFKQGKSTLTVMFTLSDAGTTVRLLLTSG